MNLSIAIDGPAGAGKSTIAKLVGKKFNLMYINTGYMYRAVTLMAIKHNIHYTDKKNLCKLIDSLSMHFENDRIIVDSKDISDRIVMPDISKNVSNYAAVLEVREKLVSIQRALSEKYNVIMDGRDIGTVVLKNAKFKFYLTASPEERAKRRYDELTKKNIEVNYNDILNDIKKRDYIDSNRKASPLKKAKDAVEIDSYFMSIEDVVNYLSKYITDRTYYNYSEIMVKLNYIDFSGDGFTIEKGGTIIV